MIRFVLLMSIFFIALQPAMSQSINQKDANGKRHGVWQKRYTKSKALRYEGQFDHGKEIGTFKFYCENCGSQPEVI